MNSILTSLSVDNATLCPNNSTAEASWDETGSAGWQPWCYAVLAMVGLPINALTFAHLLSKYRRTKSPAVILHLSLNMSDILVTSIFCIGRALWLASATWDAGMLLCKVMRYLDLFMMCSSSNTICCIAYDRLAIFTDADNSATTALTRRRRMQRVLGCVSVAWLLAAVCASPQLIVWSTVEVVSNGTTFAYCLSHWGKEIALYSTWNATLNAPNPIEDQWHYLTADIYNIYSVAALFFIPFLFTCVCYARVLVYVTETIRLTSRAFDTVTTHDTNDTSMYSITYHPSSKDEMLIRHGCSREYDYSNGQTSDSCRRGRGEDDARHSHLRRARSRSLRVAVVLAAVYLCTWLPYNVLVVWSVLHESSYVKYEHLLYVLYLLIVLNSVINPFIYQRTVCPRRQQGMRHSRKPR